jgi:hypothetical protein
MFNVVKFSNLFQFMTTFEILQFKDEKTNSIQEFNFSCINLKNQQTFFVVHFLTFIEVKQSGAI